MTRTRAAVILAGLLVSLDFAPSLVIAQTPGGQQASPQTTQDDTTLKPVNLQDELKAFGDMCKFFFGGGAQNTAAAATQAQGLTDSMKQAAGAATCTSSSQNQPNQPGQGQTQTNSAPAPQPSTSNVGQACAQSNTNPTPSASPPPAQPAGDKGNPVTEFFKGCFKGGNLSPADTGVGPVEQSSGDCQCDNSKSDSPSPKDIAFAWIPAFDQIAPPLAEAASGPAALPPRAAYHPVQAPFLAGVITGLPLLSGATRPQVSNDLLCGNQTQRWLYQVGHFSGTVQAFELCAGLSKVLKVASRPLQIALSPDGSLLLATSYDNTMTFIDRASFSITGTIKTDLTVNPSGVAFLPDGTRAYVTSYSPSETGVLVIDVAKRQIVTTIPTLSFAQSVFITPDGQQAWVTLPLSGQVLIIDTLTNTVTGTLPVPNAVGIAFNPSGTRAYISRGFSNGQLVEVDTSTEFFLRTATVGKAPEDVLVSADGRLVWVANSQDGSLSRIDTTTFLNQTVQLPGANYLHGLGLVQ